MRRRLVLAVVGLVAIILVVHDIPLRSHLKRVEQDRVITALERDAFTLAAKSQQLLAGKSPSTDTTPTGVSLSTLVSDYRTNSTAEVLIVSGEGAVQIASDPSVQIGMSFLNRPEIASALLGNSTVGVRRSETLNADLVYAAVPVLTTDSVIGAVRLTYPKSVVDARVASRLRGILLVAFISLLMAFVAALIIASSAVRPLRRLKARTEEIAEGDLSARAEVEGPPEIRELAVEELSEDLEAASGEIERLQRLVEQLLALARTEKKNVLVEVNVELVVQGRLEMWNSLAEERNVALKFATPGKVLVKAVDGTLEQILDNYIDNALDYAPEHSSISLQIEVFEREVKLSVIDEGPGMPTEARQRAFDRFWRGSESQNRPGGSGLGLSIVAQLAAASGGTVELSQNSPTGLVASVSLRKSTPGK
ncbi:MAG: ATP-binding protein [Actinobacteria bacterium]|nr:ATP-binding protein [Actinomycetota bacterium]